MHADGCEERWELNLVHCFSVNNVYLNPAFALYEMAESNIPVAVQGSDFSESFFSCSTQGVGVNLGLISGSVVSTLALIAVIIGVVFIVRSRKRTHSQK